MHLPPVNAGGPCQGLTRADSDVSGKLFGICRFDGIHRMNQSHVRELVDSTASDVNRLRVQRPISPMLAMGCGARGNQGARRSLRK